VAWGIADYPAGSAFRFADKQLISIMLERGFNLGEKGGIVIGKNEGFLLVRIFFTAGPGIGGAEITTIDIGWRLG